MGFFSSLPEAKGVDYEEEQFAVRRPNGEEKEILSKKEDMMFIIYITQKTTSDFKSAIKNFVYLRIMSILNFIR